MAANQRDFLEAVEELHLKAELPTVIRTSLTDVLGQMPATIILSYTGDASNGDIDGFVRRLHELLGNSDSVILGNIARTASHHGMESRRTA